jgi:hypothetical protein
MHLRPFANSADVLCCGKKEDHEPDRALAGIRLASAEGVNRHVGDRLLIRVCLIQRAANERPPSKRRGKSIRGGAESRGIFEEPFLFGFLIYLFLKNELPALREFRGCSCLFSLFLK